MLFMAGMKTWLCPLKRQRGRQGQELVAPFVLLLCTENSNSSDWPETWLYHILLNCLFWHISGILEVLLSARAVQPQLLRGALERAVVWHEQLQHQQQIRCYVLIIRMGQPANACISVAADILLRCLVLGWGKRWAHTLLRTWRCLPSSWVVRRVPPHSIYLGREVDGLPYSQTEANQPLAKVTQRWHRDIHAAKGSAGQRKEKRFPEQSTWESAKLQGWV